jgi:CMP/dCMP kinase
MDSVLRGVVAVDGPSGTGKSTTARGLATRLDARYLDTGAMYRAATLAVMRAGLPLDTETTAAVGPEAVTAAAVAAPLQMSTDPTEPRVRLDGEDVGAEIRGAAVTRAVSAVSALTAVREHLVAEQRRIVAEAGRDGRGIVVEGRDIGTVVVPDADLKIFLTASADVRADRRGAEDTTAGRTPGDTRADLARRDRLDSSRTASPLRPADDAVEVDTSRLDVDGVLAHLQQLAAERGLLDHPADATVGG